jgi:hypothetical protein
MKSRAQAFAMMCVAGWAGSGALAQVALEKVISNADPVPTVAGAQWLGGLAFSWGESIDQNGNVAFLGSMAEGPGGVTANDHLVAYYGAPGNLQYLARNFSEAPGLPGVTLYVFQSTNFIPLSANGNMWVGGQTPNPNGYIATGPFGNLQKVVRRNDVLPGGDVQSAIPSSATPYTLVNNNGQTAFVATPAGVYVGGPGTLQQAFIGNVGNVFINGQGNVCANGSAGGGEVLFTRAWNAAPGIFNVIARAGNPAPGCGGATYVSSTNIVFNQSPGNFNNQNHALFGCGLGGIGVTTDNNAGVWYNNGTTTTLFRRKGDVSTAVPGGATYTMSANGNESGSMRLNNSDQVAWIATFKTAVGGVDSSNNTAVVRTVLGSATDTLLARKGSPVTDPVSGTVIVPGALYGGFDSLDQNNAGQIVFRASLADDGSGTTFPGFNDEALMAWDSAHGLVLVYRTADNVAGLSFTPDDITTPSTAGQASNAEGGSFVLTDNGWLTFAVSQSIALWVTPQAIIRARLPVAAPCYPNCDGSTQSPILNVGDFTCFLQKYAAGDPYANCDNSTQPPVLNVGDFTCFLQKYAAGCH